MVHKKLVQKLSEIFLILDGDKDGFISLKAINIEILPRNTGKVLLPIFQELEMLDDGQGMIDHSEFIEAALRLYQVSALLSHVTDVMYSRLFQSVTEVR